MTQKHFFSHLICFGGLLWDHPPSGRTAGGEPMNVADHLHPAGAVSQLIRII